MSLLRRIESARPASEMDAIPAPAPGAAPVAPPPPSNTSNGTLPAVGTPSSATGPTGAAGNGGAGATTGRMLAQVPLRESFRDAKFRIQQRVISDLDPKLDLSNQVEVRREIEEAFGRALDAEGLALTRAERTRMLEQITDEIIGLGPLEPLLRDESITEVMVNGPRQVYIERSGKIELTNVTLPERRARDAHHRSHHRAARPARRRVEPDGRRPPGRRLARQRHHPADLPGRPGRSPSASSRRRR